MSEVATFRQVKNIAKGDLEDNEEFVMLKDYKDLKQELDKYKAKEKELREYILKPNNFIDYKGYHNDPEFELKELLDILDRKE